MKLSVVNKDGFHFHSSGKSLSPLLEPDRLGRADLWILTPVTVLDFETVQSMYCTNTYIIRTIGNGGACLMRSRMRHAHDSIMGRHLLNSSERRQGLEQGGKEGTEHLRQ